ncbi:hypothetical protein ACFOLC_15475 [Lysobacter cavernae]|uniref:Secreted protein n=1 Tax=Lysobacter cavernae TaxID=1685901 RepID=A0ABV7RSB7_9GAMM
MRSMLLLLLAMCSAVAAASEREPPVIPDILQNQEQIRDDAKAGEGIYKDMPERTRDDLLSRSTQLSTLLEGKQWTELNDEQQIEVFNSLEWINAAVMKAEDERLVCEQKKRPGSNLTFKVCKTVAMRRRESEGAKKMVDSLGQCTVGSVCGRGQ